MIVVDSSAVVAILFNEPSTPMLLDRLAVEADCLMSVANYVETGNVLAGRRRGEALQAIADLDELLLFAGIRLAPVDADQAVMALRARIRFGRAWGTAAPSTSATRSHMRSRPSVACRCCS